MLRQCVGWLRTFSGAGRLRLSSGFVCNRDGFVRTAFLVGKFEMPVRFYAFVNRILAERIS